MRYIMSWCYKIYIVCAFILKFKEIFPPTCPMLFQSLYAPKIFLCSDNTRTQDYIPKKHCSPNRSHRKYTVLPHMQCGTCHIKLIALTAYTDCPASVNTAVSRTKSTFSVIIHRNISITLSNAAAVFSKSALVCASDKNSDSNCDGAR